MGAIRGAICAKNTKEDISARSVELMEAIFSENSLSPDDVTAVFFSVTKDLDACYPAKAVREHFAMKDTAFMCFAEMSVVDALAHCIRVCVLVDGMAQSRCKHCYIGEASALRPDIVSGA